MRLTGHDLLALVATVGVLVLVALGKLGVEAAFTFIGGLVLRSPVDIGRQEGDTQATGGADASSEADPAVDAPQD